MAIEKLLAASFTGKGVSGLADTPNLSAGEMQAKFDELAKDVLTPKINEMIDGISGESAVRAAHEAAKNNPHSVTKAQVGLGSAENTADADKPVSTAQEARILQKFGEAAAIAQGHIANRQNPHGVTPDQIGAATPKFVRDLMATAGGSSGGLPSHSLLVNRENPDQHPVSAITGLAALLEQAEAHRQNTQNPHGVTAAQSGAVPLARKINGKPLSADVQLLPSDLGITLESGTWTPYFLGAASTIYTSQAGRYYRIGKMVTVTGNLEFSSLDGVDDIVMIHGLPFMPLSSLKQAGAAVYGLMNYSTLSSVFIESGVIRPVIQRVTGDWYTVVKSDWRFPGTIWFTVTYEIA